MATTIHVVPVTKGRWPRRKVIAWAIRIGGQHQTQQDAERAARDLARTLDAELHVHGRDGRIRKKDSLGNDPRDVAG